MISLHVLATKASKGKISREVCQIRDVGDDDLRYIKRDLLCDTLREDVCLRDVELQASIFLENGLKLHQDLKGYR
jgi:hypothetical protein